LDHIQNAVRSGPIAQEAQKVGETDKARLIRRDLGMEEIMLLFKERAESSGAVFHRAQNIEKLKDVIQEILGKETSLALAGGNALKERLGYGIQELIPKGCELIEAGDLDGDKLFSVNVALTGVDLAVAETGSIALQTGEEKARLVSLVSRVHIALVWPDQIMPDLIDFADYHAKHNLPDGLTLISGPSKTADIELKLVKGVHGPAEVHLVVRTETEENFFPSNL
jgi:L-lactate dehydrogenase complex protein LldG